MAPKESSAVKTESRIATLEANYTDLSRSVDTIMTNHLPHIQAGIDELNKNVSKLNVDFAKYIGIGIGGIAVLEILMKFILK